MFFWNPAVWRLNAWKHCRIFRSVGISLSPGSCQLFVRCLSKHTDIYIFKIKIKIKRRPNYLHSWGQHPFEQFLIARTPFWKLTLLFKIKPQESWNPTSTGQLPMQRARQIKQILNLDQFYSVRDQTHGGWYRPKQSAHPRPDWRKGISDLTSLTAQLYGLISLRHLVNL